MSAAKNLPVREFHKFAKNARVQLHPASDYWMQGDRYGTVVSIGRLREGYERGTEDRYLFRPINVKLDKSGRTVRLHPANVLEVFEGEARENPAPRGRKSVKNRWGQTLKVGALITTGYGGEFSRAIVTRFDTSSDYAKAYGALVYFVSEKRGAAGGELSAGVDDVQVLTVAQDAATRPAAMKLGHEMKGQRDKMKYKPNPVENRDNATQAIVTKYIPASNVRGSRVKAITASGISLTLHYDSGLNSYENHVAAAEALQAKMKWPGDMVGGATKDGYAFTFRDTFARENPAPRGRVTVKAAIAAIRDIPEMSASYKDGEYRVRMKGAPDADYFTNDAEDAIATANLMAGRRGNPAPKRWASSKPKNAAAAPFGYAIYARRLDGLVTVGPRMFYDGEKFSNNGKPEVFATVRAAQLYSSQLVERFPILKKYHLSIEPTAGKRIKPGKL
jgi:hypothetical protein